MYNFLRILILIIFKVLFRLEVSGEDNIPKSGGAIIVSNHISLLDPPVIGVSLSRYIHFMAKEELFKNPMFRWLIVKLKAFPVRRGVADRAAIRTAINVLDSGDLLGVFPEGTRSKTGALGEPEPGVAMIAIKTGVPIIPTAIIGTGEFGSKLLPKFKVKFGEPIVVDSKNNNRESMDQIGKTMMREISRLIEEG